MGHDPVQRLSAKDLLLVSAKTSKAILNKKVSNRKQIARQHSSHKTFDHSRGRGRPCKNFRFIFLDHRTTFGSSCVPHHVGVYRMPQKLRALVQTRPSHAKFCRSRSNGMNVCTEICQKKRFDPSRLPFRVTQGHRDRHGSIGYLRLLIS